MLSIISHEIIDKSDSYIKNQLNENFKILLNHFFNISVRVHLHITKILMVYYIIQDYPILVKA